MTTNKSQEYFLNLVKETNLSGEDFFDYLDEEIKKPENFFLVEEALSKIKIDSILILTGGFGKTIVQAMKDNRIEKRPFLLFEGGLRKSKEVKLLIDCHYVLQGCETVFFDDSIYGGGTYVSIKEWIRRNMKYTPPEKCFAIYDGCPEKRHYQSLFRYYDFSPNTQSNFKF